MLYKMADFARDRLWAKGEGNFSEFFNVYFYKSMNNSEGKRKSLYMLDEKVVTAEITLGHEFESSRKSNYL